MDLKILLTFIATSVICTITCTTADDDWTNQCNRCVCTWANGRKTANCANQNLIRIPGDLSSAIRNIDFSNNEIYSLGTYELSRANLRDVNKLKFQNCSLEQLSPSAFFELYLITELDLSKNRISTLDKDVFRQNVKLRLLILSYNNISVLEDGLFYNMTKLQRILVDNNQIQTISPDTFRNLPALIHINLSYNKIQRITFDLKKDIPKLNSLNVEGNPWICDCYLENFRRTVLKNNLITNSVECHEPLELKGRMWQDNIIFVCVPEIVEPKLSTQIKAIYSKVTLTCKVKGQPIPDVEWVMNGHLIENGTENNQQKYVTLSNITNDYIWSILTIMNLNFRDAGDYKCIAKNAGGEDERNITLIIPLRNQNTESSEGGQNNKSTFLASYSFRIIVFCICLIFVLLIVLLFVYCFCKRTKCLTAKKGEQADDSDAHINMYNINPVIKPPQSTVPPSVASGDTELTDVKRNFLDDEPYFDNHGEPFATNKTVPLRNYSLGSLESPTSSMASTTPLILHREPQNLLGPPRYDQLNPYRTLPPMWPHTALTGYQPQISKHGYVTIPRRPRQGAYNSVPPNYSNIEPDLV